jgi:hypothetical protein
MNGFAIKQHFGSLIRPVKGLLNKIAFAANSQYIQ